LRELVLDSNLLCVLVAGAVDPLRISQHARLRAYDEGDFRLLLRIVDLFSRTVVPPQVLGQTSDLLRYKQGAIAAARLSAAFSHLAAEVREQWIPSSQAVEDVSFERLGLTDAVLVMLAQGSRLLLSADLALCLTAQERGLHAVNYNHLRDGAWTVAQVEELARA
jgi:hypothetical protein